MQNEAIRKALDASAQALMRFGGENEFLTYPGRGLPDREAIVRVTRTLRSAMFPGFFDIPAAHENPYALPAALSNACQLLLEQAESAFGTRNPQQEARRLAAEAIEGFVQALPEVQRLLSTDVEALYNGDPAAHSHVDVIFSYPGLLAISVYRLAHELYRRNVPLIPRMMTEYAHEKTGIDINAGATIGDHFFIDHGTGVVIGETTVIGDQVKLYQGVTLGALSTRKGQLLKGIKRHPTLGSRVTVYSGASILGGETVIGDDCIIGSNAFVTGSVPPCTRVMNASCELSFRKMNADVWENS